MQQLETFKARTITKLSWNFDDVWHANPVNGHALCAA